MSKRVHLSTAERKIKRLPVTDTRVCIAEFKVIQSLKVYFSLVCFHTRDTLQQMKFNVSTPTLGRHGSVITSVTLTGMLGN